MESKGTTEQRLEVIEGRLNKLDADFERLPSAMAGVILAQSGEILLEGTKQLACVGVGRAVKVVHVVVVELPAKAVRGTLKGLRYVYTTVFVRAKSPESPAEEAPASASTNEDITGAVPAPVPAS